MDKLSYALGLSVGQNLLGSGVSHLDFKVFLDGVETIFQNKQLKVSLEEGQKVLEEFFSTVEKRRKEAQKKTADENRVKGLEYLNNNKSKEGVEVTASGLQYRMLEDVKHDGEQRRPTPHSRVKCHYEGRLIDGKVFDSSYMRKEPAVFSLEQVIPGWTEGLQLMSEGTKYEFTIPSEQAYGEVGVPGHIPGNSVLIFTVELLEIL